MGTNNDVVTSFLTTSLNNIGDPFSSGSFTVESKWMERNVLDYYASLWNAKWPHDPKDPDTYWSYVLTMGSSEGNLYGMWNARDYLEGKFMMSDESTGRFYYVQVPVTDNPNAFTPVAFYSQDSHYSIIKAMTVLNINTFYQLGKERYPGQSPIGNDWPEEVPSEGGDAGPGSVDVDALCTLVEFFAKEGYPILVIFNCGTTFKGAYENVEVAGKRLVEILSRYGLDWRKITVTNPETTESWRKGYWMHVDGALGASYMPFLRMAYLKQRTKVDPAPLFDFSLPFVCSIVTSSHKFPGMPWPAGVYMTKTGLQLLPCAPSRPLYIGALDTTFAGSRNGLSAVVVWSHISTYNYDAQVRKVLHCLTLTEYTYEELKKIESERPDGLSLWVVRTPLSFCVRFRKPNDGIVYKYSLANESFYYEGEPRTYTHVYCMGFTTKETLDRLFEDLRAPDAFPPESRARVVLLRPAEAKKFHRGIVGNRGLLKATKTLSHWPLQGRGFR